MRDQIIYILKHNHFAQSTYVNVMSTVFRAIGKTISIDDNLVLFVSMMGKSFGDSPRALYDAMQKDPRYNKYRCVWAFEKPEDFPEVSADFIKDLMEKWAENFGKYDGVSDI